MDVDSGNHIATIVQTSEWDDLMREITNKHGKMPKYLHDAILKETCSSSPTLQRPSFLGRVGSLRMNRQMSKSHSDRMDSCESTKLPRQRSTTCPDNSSDITQFSQRNSETPSHTTDRMDSDQLPGHGNEMHSSTILPSETDRTINRNRSKSHSGAMELSESPQPIRQASISQSGTVYVPNSYIHESKSLPQIMRYSISPNHPSDYHFDAVYGVKSSHLQRNDTLQTSPLHLQEEYSTDAIHPSAHRQRSRKRSASDADTDSTIATPRESSQRTATQSGIAYPSSELSAMEGEDGSSSPDVNRRSPGVDSGCSVGSDEDEENEEPKRSKYFRKMEADIGMIRRSMLEVSSATVSLTKQFIYAFDLIEDIKYMNENASSRESLASRNGSQELSTPGERRRNLFRRNTFVSNTKGAFASPVHRQIRKLSADLGESYLAHGKSEPALAFDRKSNHRIVRRGSIDLTSPTGTKPGKVSIHPRSHSLDFSEKNRDDEWMENVHELGTYQSFAELVRRQNDDFVAKVMKAEDDETVVKGGVVDVNRGHSSLDSDMTVRRDVSLPHFKSNASDPTHIPKSPNQVEDSSDIRQDGFNLQGGNSLTIGVGTTSGPVHLDIPPNCHSPETIRSSVGEYDVSSKQENAETLTGLRSPRLAKMFRRITSTPEQSAETRNRSTSRPGKVHDHIIRSLPSSRSSSPTSEQREMTESPTKKKGWFAGFSRRNSDEKKQDKSNGPTRRSLDERRKNRIKEETRWSYDEKRRNKNTSGTFSRFEQESRLDDADQAEGKTRSHCFDTEDNSENLKERSKGNGAEPSHPPEEHDRIIRSLPSSRAPSPTPNNQGQEEQPGNEESPIRKKGWFFGFGRRSYDERRQDESTDANRRSFDERRPIQNEELTRRSLDEKGRERNSHTLPRGFYQRGREDEMAQFERRTRSSSSGTDDELECFEGGSKLNMGKTHDQIVRSLLSSRISSPTPGNDESPTRKKGWFPGFGRRDHDEKRQDESTDPNRRSSDERRPIQNEEPTRWSLDKKRRERNSHTLPRGFYQKGREDDMAQFERRTRSSTFDTDDELEYLEEGSKLNMRKTHDQIVRSLPSSRVSSPTPGNEESPTRKKSWFSGFGRRGYDEKRQDSSTDSTRRILEESRRIENKDPARRILDEKKEADTLPREFHQSGREDDMVQFEGRTRSPSFDADDELEKSGEGMKSSMGHDRIVRSLPSSRAPSPARNSPLREQHEEEEFPTQKKSWFGRWSFDERKREKGNDPSRWSFDGPRQDLNEGLTRWSFDEKKRGNKAESTLSTSDHKRPDYDTGRSDERTRSHSLDRDTLEGKEQFVDHNQNETEKSPNDKRGNKLRRSKTVQERKSRTPSKVVGRARESSLNSPRYIKLLQMLQEEKATEL